MTKLALLAFFLVAPLLLANCAAHENISAENCEFSFAVLGFDKERVIVTDKTEVISDRVTKTPEKATEVSDFTTLNVDVPAQLKFDAESSKTRSLYIKNCDKLGIVLSKQDRGVQLVHIDNFFFE